MNTINQPIIFGEVLFDCFPDGEEVLGGAPFNVAWHLQAFGDRPDFVSRVGDDDLGKAILNAMQKWGMDTSYLQIDPHHQTGRVDIELVNDEPHYSITPDCAYDFISADAIEAPHEAGILYHGTLGLRNQESRQAFDKLANTPGISTFMDVNLRPPWWQKATVQGLLKKARWVKLNHDELGELGTVTNDIHQDMALFQDTYDLDLLILTQGAEGASVRNRAGEVFSVVPQNTVHIVDTVGAGDAFTAVFLHGLIQEWPLQETLESAQQFASYVVGIRGALSVDKDFYKSFRH